MPKIFISSSAQDRPLAAEIATALEQHGMQVWSSDRLPPGGRIEEAIKNAVRDSDACLVIQAPARAKDFIPRWHDHVDMEWDAIFTAAPNESNRKILPVIPEGRTVSPLWRDWVPIRIARPLDADRLVRDVDWALSARSTEQEPFTAEERVKQRQRAREIRESLERIEAEP
jgi:TIR domain